jgi:hypothetical protein
MMLLVLRHKTSGKYFKSIFIYPRAKYTYGSNEPWRGYSAVRGAEHLLDCPRRALRGLWREVMQQPCQVRMLMRRKTKRLGESIFSLPHQAIQILRIQSSNEKKKTENGESRKLRKLCLFIWRFLVKANQLRDFCCFAPERKSGGREKEDGHIFPLSHMIRFPCDTFQSLGKEKGGAPREWGWGWEDGLTVNPAPRHLVSLPGSRL